MISTDEIQKLFSKNFELFEVKGVVFAPNILQAVAIVFLLFLLVFTLARLRHLYVKWSFKTAYAFILIGFLLALILEGFFILGGRTVLTEILGWKNPPKPIESALDFGRERMVEVLGVRKEVPSSFANENSTSEDLLNLLDSLSQQDLEKVRLKVCSE